MVTGENFIDPDADVKIDKKRAKEEEKMLSYADDIMGVKIRSNLERLLE